jgi:hypothetical protein
VLLADQRVGLLPAHIFSQHSSFASCLHHRWCRRCDANIAVRHHDEYPRRSGPKLRTMKVACAIARWRLALFRKVGICNRAGVQDSRQLGAASRNYRTHQRRLHAFQSLHQDVDGTHAPVLEQAAHGPAIFLAAVARSTSAHGQHLGPVALLSRPCGPPRTTKVGCRNENFAGEV